MLREVTQFLLVSFLALWVGGNWIFLQSCAWVSMTVSFSQQASVSQAIRWTFDGQHPCQLCKIVKEGRKSETKSPGLLVSLKVEFISQPGTIPIWGPSQPLSFAPPPSAISLTAEPPPLPPPIRRA